MIRAQEAVFEKGGVMNPLLPREIGPYTIVREIHRTDHASILEAVDPKTGQHVTIKRVHAHLVSTTGVNECLHLEARVLQQATSHNVIRYHAHGLESIRSRYYLVMEYADTYRDLKEYLRGKMFDWQTSCEIVIQICRGMASMHECGIIHRDLKPENVLLRSDAGVPRVKVIDFGLAKYVQSMPDDYPPYSRAPTLGTPEYMPPEQIEHADHADTRTDVFAIALILYWLLTGEEYYPCRHLEEESAEYLKRRPIIRARRDAPNSVIPQRVWNVMRKGLALNPDDRPRDARAFLALLEAAMRRAKRDHARWLRTPTSKSTTRPSRVKTAEYIPASWLKTPPPTPLPATTDVPKRSLVRPAKVGNDSNIPLLKTLACGILLLFLLKTLLH